MKGIHKRFYNVIFMLLKKRFMNCIQKCFHNVILALKTRFILVIYKRLYNVIFMLKINASCRFYINIFITLFRCYKKKFFTGSVSTYTIYRFSLVITNQI